ncbi:MAG: universal stress protein [Bacteroidia bacterium]|nr:universal stress protein [Bacteroidia bacterium]
MKKLLFPSDYTPAADAAFPFAVRIASAYGSEILLVHAYSIALTADMVAPNEYYGELVAEEERRAGEQLIRYQEEARRLAGQDIPIRLFVRSGFATDVIEELCEAEEPDMIIMGTNGAANWLDARLGSITTQVIQSAHIPVLAVPAEARYQGIHEIVYASDYAEKDLSVSSRLGDIARKVGARLNCVHVAATPQPVPAGFDLTTIQALYRQETGFADLQLSEVRAEDVISGLSDYLELHPADVIALTTRHRSFFARVFNPSVTRELALYSRRPLLVFHA